MSKPRINRPLPIPGPDYDQQNEAVTRRTLEQRLDDIEQSMEQNKNKTSASSSMALRRFQFLLMGAQN
jgi:hypothetical protein